MSVRPLLCFLLLCLIFDGCSLFKTKYEEIPPRFPGSISTLGSVDSEWKVRSLRGDTRTLGEFLGKKLFINFWATWCGPCLAEMPGLQALYDSRKDDTTLVFLFISDEDEKTVRTFLSQSPHTLPVYLCARERSPEFNSGAYPSTFIVNPLGQVVHRKYETAKWNHSSVIDFIARVE